jgi:hypothetical protein
MREMTELDLFTHEVAIKEMPREIQIVREVMKSLIDSGMK